MTNKHRKAYHNESCPLLRMEKALKAEFARRMSEDADFRKEVAENNADSKAAFMAIWDEALEEDAAYTALRAELETDQRSRCYQDLVAKATADRLSREANDPEETAKPWWADRLTARVPTRPAPRWQRHYTPAVA